MNEPIDKWQCLRCGEEFECPREMQPSICPNPNCGKKALRALTGPMTFFDYVNGKFKFIPKKLADHIQKDNRFLTHINTHVCWVYNGGSYLPTGMEFVRGQVRNIMYDLATEGISNETVAQVKETTYAEPERFESPVNLINFKNGVFNIDTQELTPHTPDVVFLNELPVEWKPDAKCPKILNFLEQVVAKDSIPVLQETAGYCLYRKYILARALMLLGEGNNGKSTWLNVLSALLGKKNTSHTSIQDLLENRFARADLYGKLASIYADIPTAKLENTGIFKMLTGQDTVRAELKNQNAFDFENYAKLLFSANELPRTNDKTEAFWRRWIVIVFPNRFPEDDPNTDPDLIGKLTTPEELSGLLNWALEGLQRLLKNKKFSVSDSWVETEKLWIQRTDSLRSFVTNHVNENPLNQVAKDKLYEAYLVFCTYHDVTPQQKPTVGRRLPALFPKIKETHPTVDGKQVRAWAGLELVCMTDITDMTELATPNTIGNDDSINRGVGEQRHFRNIWNIETDPQTKLSQHTKANIVISVISALDEDAADLNEVIRRSLEKGITQDFVEVYVAEEKRRGHLYEPRPGFIRRSVR
jgi:putative DNA primase/helicase